MNLSLLREIIDEVPNKNYIKSYIKKNNIELYSILEKEFETNRGNYVSFNEYLFLIYNDLKDKPVCKICGKDVKFDSFTKGYRVYCSPKCSNKDNDKKETIKKTCIEKYGVPTMLLESNTKEKIKNNNSYTEEEFIERLNQVYNKDEYTLLEPFINCSTKINFRHNTCNREFNKRPSLLLNDHGCPHCGHDNRVKSLSINQEEFIRRTLENNDNRFTVVGEYKNSNSPIKLECNICHKEFFRGRANDVINKTLGCPYCNCNGTSKSEEELYEFIHGLDNNLTIIRNDKSIIKPLELDMFLPDLNIAIEFDGLYWHSEERGKDKNYHLHKTSECNKKGIRLIHVFEDEWINKNGITKEKIKHILGYDKNKIKVYARKCIIKEIDSTTKNSFLNENHIQGEDKSKIKLGLYYNNELVSVMTFNNLRLALGNKNVNEDDYELVRFANSLKYNVLGSFGKLFKYFIRNYEFNEIKTFADLRWSSNENNIYTNNNFEYISISKPNYWYVNKSNSIKRYHRFNFNKQRLKQLFPNEYSDDKTEKEIMNEVGYYRIYDCGNIVYKYTI